MCESGTGRGLVDPRQDSVGNQPAVLVPVAAVFFGAALVISVAANDDQEGHEDEVELRQDRNKDRRHTPQERRRKLGQIVEVTRQTPVPRGE